MAETKLYYIPNIQNLVYESSYDLRLENLPMNRFDTLIYKGSNNTIDFSIRDKDRKPINLLDKTLTATISNTETRTVVHQKQLEKLDEVNGFARLTLTANDTDMLSPGFYTYSVKIVEDNGREQFSYTDQSYRVTGQFELKESAIPALATVNEVTLFLSSEINNDTAYYSDPVKPGFEYLHTAVFYLTNFRGEIGIEVSINDRVPDNNEWAEIYTQTYSVDKSGLVYYNIEGNYSWVRFKYNPNELNTGSVDKVLFS